MNKISSHRCHSPRILSAAILVVLYTFFVAPMPVSFAETIRLSPPAGCGVFEALENAVKRLQPGDELVFEAGTYCQTNRRLFDVSGTSDKPITIRGMGADRTILTRPEEPSARQKHNGTEFRGSYLIIRGLHFRGGNRGLVFHAGSHHITVEDNEVSHTANNGMTLNNGDTAYFTIRRNHIHHTGNLDPAIGGTEGEGMYIGCNRARCIAHDHLIEDNLIHDLRANGVGGNDGIEIKYGSYGNIVRNNVIHTIFPAFGTTKYPCIFVYGTLERDQYRPNVVEKNLLSGCGEAIQVVSDAIIRDNTILASQSALATYYHEQVPVQRNVQIENNVFFGSRLALQFGLQGGNKEESNYIAKPAPEHIVFSGNQIYGPGISPLITVDFPKGGDIQVMDNRVGDTSASKVRVISDPSGLITSRSFVSRATSLAE